MTAEGLLVRGVSAADEGDYTCRAEVEADGRYDERRIHVEVHGKFAECELVAAASDDVTIDVWIP